MRWVVLPASLHSSGKTMPNAIQPWNGQQILAQNAQYSQAEAAAKLGVQEINDQSQLEQALKTLPKDLSMMQQLEQIQTLALQHGKLDAAEKAVSMMGLLQARTDASMLKVEQATATREKTLKDQKNQIFDMLSAAHDEPSWRAASMMASSIFPDAAKTMLPLLSQGYDPKTVAGLVEGRMTPAERAKAAKEAEDAAAEEAKRQLVLKQIAAFDPMEKLKEANERSQIGKNNAETAYLAAKKSYNDEQAARKRKAGGVNTEALHSVPNNTDIATALKEVTTAAPGLDSDTQKTMAADLALKVKELVATEPGMTASKAMQMVLPSFRNQLVTEDPGGWRNKTVTYVPRPDSIPLNYKAIGRKPSAAEIAAGVPAEAQLWENPTNPKDVRWSTD